LLKQQQNLLQDHVVFTHCRVSHDVFWNQLSYVGPKGAPQARALNETGVGNKNGENP